MDFEQSKFTGGLVLKPTPDQLNPHECQEAENVEFVREVGAVCPRRGIDKYYSRDLDADEVYWQRTLGTPGPIVRAGDRLYDGLRPVYCGLTDSPARFEEFGNHVILANGYENLKYKQSGMGLTVHTAYCYDNEYDVLVDADIADDIVLGAYVQSFLHVYGDPLGEGDAEWRCTFEWERKTIEGTDYDLSDTELVENGDFADWTTDNPDVWALVTAEDATNYVTEASGQCRIVSDGSKKMGINDNPLTSGKFYRFSIDVKAVDDGAIEIELSSRCAISNINTTGVKTYNFQATGTTFQIYRNEDGVSCDVTIDDVSVKEITEDSDDFYTSSCYESRNIETTPVDVMDVCRAVDLGLPVGQAVSGTVESASGSMKTQLLVHCEGADESTSFTDAAQSRTITANGGAQVDTGKTKVGSATLLLDGDGDYLSVAWSSAFNPGTDRFSIEFWVRFDAVPTSRTGLFSTGYANKTIYIKWDYSKIFFTHYDSSLAVGSRYLQVSANWTPAADTWYHIYVCRGWDSNDDMFAVCIDGSVVATEEEERTIEGLTGDLYIGMLEVFEGTTSLNGSMDEIRYVVGEAPYRANFTAPTSAYSTTFSGTFKYRMTNVNYDGREGNAGGFVLLEPSSEVSYLTIPISDDPQVVARNIYRTETGGATYQFLTTVSNNHSQVYEDSAPDSLLGMNLVDTQEAPPIFSEVHDRQSLLHGVEAANKNKIWYCNAFDDWDAFRITNYSLFGSNNDETVALESLGENLVGVQGTRIWRYNTEEDPEILTESFSSIGSPVGYAVINVGDALLIVDATGMYYFDAVKELKLSYKIDPLLDPTGSYTERINSSYLTNIRTGFIDDRIYVSYTRTGQTTNDRTIIYNRKFKCFEGVIQTGFTSFTTDKEAKVLLGIGTDGYVYQLETGNDDEGSAIVWNFRTKDFASELVGSSLEVKEEALSQKSRGRLLWKRGGKIRLDLNPVGETVTVQVYHDDTVRQTRTFDDASRTVHEFRVNPDYDFTRLSVKISGSSTTAQMFYGIRFVGVTVVGEGQ